MGSAGGSFPQVKGVVAAAAGAAGVLTAGLALLAASVGGGPVAVGLLLVAVALGGYECH